MKTFRTVCGTRAHKSQTFLECEAREWDMTLFGVLFTLIGGFFLAWVGGMI